MKERVVEILVFLMTEMRDDKQLHDIDLAPLRDRGYTTSEISAAFSWLYETMGAGDPETTSHARAARGSRRILHDVAALADKTIDTSHLAPPEVKEMVLKTLGLRHPRGMAVVVESFGYKHGVPMDADVVWDVRFLPNPNYVADLRPLTGLSPRVSRYVLDNPLTKRFLEHLSPLMDFLLDRFAQEGKSYLTLAVGCTGGRHRSVAVAEALAKMIRSRGRFDVRIHHRDTAR